MRLYLIRHCESENNALWARTGSNDGRSADPPLSARGIAQAGLLADFLAAAWEPSPAPHEGGPLRDGLAFDHLYTSLMQRSIQTGYVISQKVGLPLVAWIDIHERGGIYLDDPQTGEPAGLPGPGRSFFETTYPYLGLPELLEDGGWWNRPYEKPGAALSRAALVLRALLDRHGDDDASRQPTGVAFVTHGGFTQSLLSVLFGFTPEGQAIAGERSTWFKMNNGAITRIDITGDLLRLSYLNYIDYMPGELLS